MTASDQNKSPDFFEDHDLELDPLTTATGTNKGAPHTVKRKAGFYLSVELLERFNRQFHKMKLDDMAIENKSALLEIALSYALDDLEKGKQSKISAALK